MLPVCQKFYFLVIAGSVLLQASCTTTAPPGILLTTSSPGIHEGFTRDLEVNCSVHPGQVTSLAAVMSVIMSKEGSGDSTFSEIATVTLVSNHVNVKDDLGGQVTGHLATGEVAFLSYKWRYPRAEVQGRYQCTVTGINKLGHPIEVNAYTEIREQSVSLQMVLEKIHDLELAQTTLTSQLEETSARLNQSETELASSRGELAAAMFDLNTTRREVKDAMASRNATQLQLAAVSQQLRDVTDSCDDVRAEIQDLKAAGCGTCGGGQDLSAMKTQLHKAIVILISVAAEAQLDNITFITGELEQVKGQLDMTPFFVTSHAHAGHRYFLSISMMNNIPIFSNICEHMGGYLLEINDQAEFDAIEAFIKGTNIGYYDVMLGMSDAKQEGAWQYLYSGLPVTFTKWASGEPNDGKTWNCAEMNTGSMLMYDIPCVYTSRRRFICELE